jgi:WhiB family transcriptional regulator, redox-sensing transcriptional regulator
VLAIKQDWRSIAECQFADPDLFFPISAAGKALPQVAEAKEICARCQVRRECLTFALLTGQRHGVWGGMSEEERYRLERAS